MPASPPRGAAGLNSPWRRAASHKPREGAWLRGFLAGSARGRGGLAGAAFPRARDSAAYARVSGVGVWDPHLLHGTEKETLQSRAGRGLRGHSDGPEATGCVLLPDPGLR